MTEILELQRIVVGRMARLQSETRARPEDTAAGGGLTAHDDVAEEQS